MDFTQIANTVVVMDLHRIRRPLPLGGMLDSEDKPLGPAKIQSRQAGRPKQTSNAVGNLDLVSTGVLSLGFAAGNDQSDVSRNRIGAVPLDPAAESLSAVVYDLF